MKKFWLKTFVGHIMSYLNLLLVYRYWSRIYRFIWERQYRYVPVTTYKSLQELVLVIQTCKWSADGWKQLWDAFSYPGKVQYIINTQPPEKRFIGDCDEHALYIATALERTVNGENFSISPYAEWRNSVIESAQVLTVNWINKDGVYGGHNVCLITFYDRLGVTAYSYMDYGQPSIAKDTVRKVVQQVMDRYARDGIVLAWAIHDKDLHLKEVHLS